MFRKGDILLPSNRVAKRNWLNGLHHPAVVWQNHYDGNSDFKGVMLTHASPDGQFDNILMASNHFEDGYEVGFSDTHFVNQLFIKFQKWGPFELVGKLTKEGIMFIEENLNTKLLPIDFIQYVSSPKNSTF